MRSKGLKSIKKCVIIITIPKGKDFAGKNISAKIGKRDMEYKIALISGDGIGPEIVTEAQKVLNAVGEKFGHSFQYT